MTKYSYLIISRRACGIQHDDVFIVTGGFWNEATVSQYNVTGWVKDLPRLNTGRLRHGCGYFYSHSIEMVYNEMYLKGVCNFLVLLGDWWYWEWWR